RRRVAARAGDTPLHHYTYRAFDKRSGGCRLIEIPKGRLREAQRGILHGLLDRVPPHDAAHGFRKGRGIVSFAAPHADRDVVIRFDVADFFASVSAPKIHALFDTLGYPAEVVRTLTALCTNRVPSARLLAPDLRDRLDWPARQRYRNRHLPQGAPTSPALANLCAFRLDARLAALARSLDATYTRYADDLAFSGGAVLMRAAQWLTIQVAAIALEEGFALQLRKTRVMRRGVRQQLAGVVVNRHPNLARDEFDTLKAMLTNCARHGPVSQNRDAHPDFHGYLAGRVAHATMLNAARGLKLQAIFERIAWDTDDIDT
ncbi:RNA-directed DNA polymerase, partial [Paraburkholderia sp. Se-20369]|nr:RNA-directed DNA polymerase [Paraburkholderia sp. Se-20369]